MPEVKVDMGGGEVARYVAAHGEDRLRSVVFAAAVTPTMIDAPGNPRGLNVSHATEFNQALVSFLRQ